MRSIAIIPARGESKRIPRKNIKDFLGKPIIAYSIEAALNSGLFDEVMVSTDDINIANIAKKIGAEVPFMRTHKNADDYATTVEVLLEVIHNYEAIGMSFKYGCCIYPTAPFVTPEILLKSKELLVQKEYDCVFPVLQFSSPIQRALQMNPDGRIEMFYPEFQTIRSQDLPPAYHDSGQFYWFDILALKKNRQLWTHNTGAIPLSALQAHDIDNEEDWSIAEFKFQITFGKNKNKGNA